MSGQNFPGGGAGANGDVTIAGTGFKQGAIVQINGVDVNPSQQVYKSDKEMHVLLPNNPLFTAGNGPQITVKNPDKSISNSAKFVIQEFEPRVLIQGTTVGPGGQLNTATVSAHQVQDKTGKVTELAVAVPIQNQGPGDAYNVHIDLAGLVEGGVQTTSPISESFTLMAGQTRTVTLLFPYPNPLPSIHLAIQVHCDDPNAGISPAFTYPVMVASPNFTADPVNGVTHECNSDSGGSGNGDPVTINYKITYPTSDPTQRIETYMIIPGDVRVLKQFWRAGVLVRNNSSLIIKNVVSTLGVPSGLALPDLNGAPQSNVQTLGDILAQASAQAQYAVRGDRAGTYTLTGTANGTLQLGGSGVPLVSSLTSDPFKVIEPKLLLSFSYPGSDQGSNPPPPAKPNISNLYPKSLPAGNYSSTPPIVITGSGFASGCEVLLNNTPTPVQNGSSDKKLIVDIDPSALTVGHDISVQVVNPDSTQSNVTQFDVFAPVNAPHLDLAPSSGATGYRVKGDNGQYVALVVQFIIANSGVTDAYNVGLKGDLYSEEPDLTTSTVGAFTVKSGQQRTVRLLFPWTPQDANPKVDLLAYTDYSPGGFDTGVIPVTIVGDAAPPLNDGVPADYNSGTPTGTPTQTANQVTAGVAFPLGISVTNQSTIDLNGVSVELKAGNLVHAHLASGQPAAQNIGTIATDATATVTYQIVPEISGYINEVTDQVSASPQISPNLDIEAVTLKAGDDTATLPANISISIPVLANDLGQGDLRVTEAAHPSHGSVTSDGSTINYTPDAGYTGQDSFTYTVADEAANTASATVHITVTSPSASIASLSPSSATQGDAGFTLTITGTGFVLASRVAWNGQPRSATYVSPTTLTISVSQSDLANSGQIPVTVTNPGASGLASQIFTVGVLTPVITSLSQTSAAVHAVNSPDLVITVTGSGFLPNSAVHWKPTGTASDKVLATTYISSTSLQAHIPASLIDAPGGADVTVVSLAPNRIVSNAAPFAIGAISLSVAGVTFGRDSAHNVTAAVSVINNTNVDVTALSLTKLTLVTTAGSFTASGLSASLGGTLAGHAAGTATITVTGTSAVPAGTTVRGITVAGLYAGGAFSLSKALTTATLTTTLP